MRIDVMRVPGPSRTDTLIALPTSPTSAPELARHERESRFLARRIEDL
jgi:hypothetical protein